MYLSKMIKLSKEIRAKCTLYLRELWLKSQIVQNLHNESHKYSQDVQNLHKATIDYQSMPVVRTLYQNIGIGQIYRNHNIFTDLMTRTITVIFID